MIGLPVQLSVMQNQAIECDLFDLPLSTRSDETLKKMIVGKDVKIFVETVECNSLVVRLFDTHGNKIKVIETQNSETISPICSMQILSSTHDVTVSWINSSNSIWLQRISEKTKIQQLLEELSNYYSKVKECVVPIENQVYAALNNDGIWYRAKVTKLNETKSTIMLVDFGTIVDVPIENLRTLKPQFYVPHQLSVEVSLTVSLGGSLSAERDVLQPIMMNKVFSATLYNVNRKWIAELTENGEKISEKLVSLDVVTKTAQKQFEYVELPDMLVGEKYEVIVSHVDSPNQLWLQRSEQMKNIAELQNQLQRTSTPFFQFGVVPAVKSLCLAMYSLNNQWYRSEVLDADVDITTVRFIDYGSTDVIDNSMARLKQLPDKWKAIDGYAIPCKLDVLPATADDWPKEACARFSDLVLTQKTLQALIITNKAPMRVDLFLDDQSICKMLVEERYAAYLNCSEELEEEVIEEIELDPRSAFVSSIISVDTFWMQEDKYVNELEMMQDRLVMAPILQPVTEIKEGLICIAHFPEDNYYYRAIVLSQNEDGTRVRYIDYGNSALTKDLRTIPEDLVDIRPLSRKCGLAKPDGVEHWPHGINDEFTKLADEGSTIFLLDVIEEGETCLVKLAHDSKDVAMKLLELCAKSNQSSKQDNILAEVEDIKTEERLSPICKENLLSTEECTISYVNSPSEFWIHKKSHYSDLDVIMDKLLVAESLDLVTEINEGKMVAAKFDEDGQWYRSKILSHGESGTEVFYIDYGNAAVTDSQSTLRELPDNLVRIPPLATCCSLKMPDGIENWSKTACEKFMDLTEDVTIEYRFEVHETSSQRLESEQPVQLSLFYQGQNVSEILMNHEETVKTDKMDEQETEESRSKIITSDSTIETMTVQQHSQEGENNVHLNDHNIQIEIAQTLQECIDNIPSIANDLRIESEKQESQECINNISFNANDLRIEVEKQESQECINNISSNINDLRIEAENLESQECINNISSNINDLRIEAENLESQECINNISVNANDLRIEAENQESKKCINNTSFNANDLRIEAEKQESQECINNISFNANDFRIETENQESKKCINNTSFNANDLRIEAEKQESQEYINNTSINANDLRIEVEEQKSQECINNTSFNANDLRIEAEKQESQECINNISSNINDLRIEAEKQQLQESKKITYLLDDNIRDETKEQKSQESTNEILTINNSNQMKMEKQQSQESKDTISSIDNNNLEIESKGQESQ